MSSLVGTVVGPYQVLLRIRSTPINTIYKAYNQKLGRNVALQVILPGSRMPQGLPRRLMEHVKMLGRLAHPNIGAVLDCELYEGYLCVAYDFVPRRMLARRFNQKMAWKQAARQLVPAAQALAYAHAQGVTHGFIRPSSILINESGTPVLFDFGVEQVVVEEVLAETAGSWLGSQVSSYAAPEQVLGKPSDTRADIYSMGMVLYELLAGRRVYEGETPVEEALQQYHKPVKDLSKQRKERLNREAPRLGHLTEMEVDILERMLAPDPAQRFQDMQHVAVLLARYALNQPVNSMLLRNPNWKPRKPVHPLVWAALGLLMLCMLGVGAVAAVYTFPDAARSLGIEAPSVPEQIANIMASPTHTPTATPAPTATAAPTATKAPTATLAPNQPTPTLAPTATQVPFRDKPQTRLNLPLLFGTPIPSVSGSIAAGNALRMVTLSRLGIGRLNEVAWSPDSPASAAAIGLATTTGAYVVNPETGALETFIDTTGTVHCLAFSPDGTKIATGEKGGLVRLWERATGKEIFAMGGHLGQVNRLAFSPDGKRLASVSDDNTARLWDLENQKLIASLNKHVQGVTGLAFAPDGKTLVTVSLDFHLKFWDAATGEQKLDKAYGSAIYDVAYSPDGKVIYTGGGDSVIQMWDAASGEKTEIVAIMSAVITELKASADGKLLAASDESGQVSVYDAKAKGARRWSNKNTRLPHVMGANYPYTHHISISPDSTRVASGIWDDTVRIWNAADGTDAGQIDQFSDFVNGMKVSPDGKYLAAQTIGGQVKVWDLPNTKLLYTYTGELLFGRAFSYNSQYLAIKTSANTLKVYQLSDGKEKLVFGGHGELKSSSFSKDGIYLVAGSFGEVHTWSLVSGQEFITERTLSGTGCTSITIMSGLSLVRATRFNYLDFEDTKIKNLCSFNKVGWMLSTDIQLDGKMMAAGGASILQVWDYSVNADYNEKAGKKMDGLSNTRTDQIALSPDGQIVAAGVDDLSIRVWNAATGKEIVRLMGHEETIKSLLFTPDSKYLISSSNDGTIRIWGVQ